MEGLRGQVHQDREGEEGPGEGGGSHTHRDHGTRGGRGDGEGEAAVSVADVRGILLHLMAFFLNVRKL